MKNYTGLYVVLGAVGGFLAKEVLADRDGRKRIVDAIRRGFQAKDWLVRQAELLGEDVEDIVAEARQSSRPVATASKNGSSRRKAVRKA